MKKMRIYEYAKEKNVSSKIIIKQLEEMGIEVSNHMSVITGEVIEKLEAKQSGKSSQPKGENKAGAGKKTSSPNASSAPGAKNKKPAKPGPANRGSGQQQKNNQANQNKRNHSGKKKRGQRPAHHQQEQKKAPAKELPSKITYTLPITVGNLAEKIGKEPSEIIKKLMGIGIMATINQEIDKDAIELLAAEFGIEAEEEIIIDETEFENFEQKDDPASLKERPPVVTIMGHVDHGKTTLLDSIRHTKVTAGEAGGITQHIGAYQVEENGKKITFLDTPGHAAFTTMRARGAQVTDITILVVAADDGVMPQTLEAINHAKAAKVPIIVAVNKIDKEAANPDRVMQELTEQGLVSEAWGGDTIFVNVSAINGTGIDELLEMILLVAEVEEYKANYDKPAQGTVIEAELDRGRGPVATLLVQGGTLKVGDTIVVGNTFGRVRAMVNDRGRRVKTAAPSTPVEITGLNAVPQAGDQFLVFEDEKKARQIGEARATKQREAERRETSKVSLDDLFQQIQQGNIKEINVIIKADVQGSVEAMRGSLEKIEVEGVKINIIHTGVGAIAESDIILASASNAIVIGFNVRPDVNAKRTAESEKVDIRLHRVIYNAIEEVEAAMKGMLDPEFREKVIGQAEVRQIFKVSKIGTIAGSYVTEGKITRGSTVRLIRDGVVIFEGEINALKRFKDDVKEVAQNYECGITLENFNDVKEGDIIEAYIMEEIKR
ncbi:translation initiation factor IF-2 [Evansella caseinilytica]|uniref:Translation initiation factor IF-2 n=1 Tax=Evansella caseinilytica TaxID=1503961 RepID=A0A1H3M2S3_9BACI|nr:translation initiation factor IF-2 [Evansella caseinilytica]SDY70519.1 translation initiation factor IF-2 [Evansella caseinilytica]